jgi:pyruvate,water dikinase
MTVTTAPITADSPADTVRRHAGGKGYHLYRLTEAGFPVPKWAALGSPVFADFLRANKLADRVDTLLARTSAADAERIAAEICALIEAGMLDAVWPAIRDAYDTVAAELVAVRSSTGDEDGTEFSFAGQFETFLNVSGLAETAERVRRCWASAFSARSLLYRLRHGIPLRANGIAVIIQRMVPAEHSGVLFTANPLTGDARQFMLTIGSGLGDAVVSGSTDTHTITLNMEQEPLPDNDMLDTATLGRLRAIGTDVTTLLGRPQDIEWAVADGEVWLLQSRPITTGSDRRPTLDDGLRIWDNSNIIESFSGITSPLTYSFAADVYARVYREYGRALRLPPAQLRQLDEWLPEMLGYFHGRVYYNLLHWYRMVRMAPLYRLNRRVLEAALGVAEPVPDDLADAVRPYAFRSPLTRVLSRTITVTEFTRRFVTMDRSVRRFVAYFYRAHSVFDRMDYEALPAPETYRRFRELERDLIEKWGPMMALDASLLICLGVLYLLGRRWLPDAPEWFTLAVASPGPEIESIEPVHALNDLAARVRADLALSDLIDRTPAEKIYAELAQAGQTEFLAAVDDYLNRFGDRSFDELKLEVPELREDPTNLFVLLRNTATASVQHTATDAESYLDENLRGPRRFVFDLVRRKTRSSLANRERLRFCRTRAFASAKRMLRAIGRDLAASGLIEDRSDVFFLRLEEVRGIFAGTIAHAELPGLVDLRKRQRDRDAVLPAPARFTTTGVSYTGANLAAAGWAGTRDDTGPVRQLRGLPSAPGVAEGPAVVAEAPTDVRGGILLAYRTDPGWVPALSSAAALVIERGSPLTHVAIVARELGIPTVVQVPEATSRIRTGMRLRVDGGSGLITVLDTGEVAR